MLLAGCATTGGASLGPGVPVRSNSSGVAVRILDLESNTELASGNAPLTLRRTGSGLYRGGRFLITVQKPGEQSKSFPLKLPTVNYGGLLGWIIVDPDSGELWRLANERSGISWEPAPGEATFEHTTGYVIATLGDVKSSPRAIAEMERLPMRAR
jgi:hypothetical protein